VRRFVEDEEMFLANYADVLTDAPLPDMVSRFERSSAVAGLIAVPLQSSHHVVDIGDDGLITQVTPMQDLKQWENGGYFMLRPEIFDHLNPGEDLVEDAIPRLIPQRKVLAYPYKGYFSPPTRSRSGSGWRRCNIRATARGWPVPRCHPAVLRGAAAHLDPEHLRAGPVQHRFPHGGRLRPAGRAGRAAGGRAL
jgi:hypothetical protein